jgi:uncharacterized protein (DUF433 family)
MNATLPLLPESLRIDSEGAIRIGQSRVTLDTLAAAFASGATPEQIVIDYPTLDLADVYSAIGYILRNRDSVKEYLAAGEAEAQAFRASHPNLYAVGVRERLLARQKSKAP